MMPPKVVPKFNEGERVLCFHGPLLYEAKCVKSETKEKSVRYFIHYNGWNKNWDEWVPESRVLKYNEASLQKQKDLSKAHSKSKQQRTKNRKVDKEKKEEKEKERANTPTLERNARKDKAQKTATTTVAEAVTPAPSTPNPLDKDEPKKKRARMDTTVESDETFMTKIEVKIKVPDELKPWLVDDWDLITRQKKLVSLPCKVTVDSILDEWVKSKLIKGNNPNKDAILEASQGIRQYFNVMLGTQLLYKFE